MPLMRPSHSVTETLLRYRSRQCQPRRPPCGEAPTSAALAPRPPQPPQERRRCRQSSLALFQQKSEECVRIAFSDPKSLKTLALA